MPPRTALWTLLAALGLSTTPVVLGQASPNAPRPAGDRPTVEVSGPSDRVTPKALPQFAAAVKIQALALSRLLGYQQPAGSEPGSGNGPV